MTANHHPGETSPCDEIGASRAARALVGAGFKGDVKRRALRGVARSSQGSGFGMGATTGLRPPAPDDFAILDQNRPDRRIRLAEGPSARR